MAAIVFKQLTHSCLDEIDTPIEQSSVYIEEAE